MPNVNDIINSVRAASAVHEYELAMELLKSERLDNTHCFYCGNPSAYVHIRCIGNGRLRSIYPDDLARTHQRHWLGWTHLPCSFSIRYWRPNTACNHAH